ncbi:MAG: GNAT family N-acetyltransferase [Clostridiales bacterium]|nr:GNAT family N-acetyltransferase [Clostridiales bacterium]
MPEVQKWFSDTAEYRFATGVNGTYPDGRLEQAYLKMGDSDTEFYLGIALLPDNRLIGVISGKIRERILWISIMAVKTQERRNGFGSQALEIVLRHMAELFGISEVYLSVAQENTWGMNFWKKNGFAEIKTITDKKLFDEDVQSICIMERRL